MHSLFGTGDLLPYAFLLQVFLYNVNQQPDSGRKANI